MAEESKPVARFPGRFRGRRGQAVLAATSLAAALVVAVVPASAAHAEEVPADTGIPGNVTGGDVTAPSVEQPLDEQAKAKVALAEASYAVNIEGASGERLAALERDYRHRFGSAGYRPADARAVSSDAVSPGAVSLGAVSPSSVSAAAALPKRVLGLTQYAQTRNYYCGPAAGYMIIRYLHGASFRSRYNRASLSQRNLATRAHMNTDAVGATTWVSKRFVRGVNRWRGNLSYAQVSRPSVRVVTGALTHSIGEKEMPLAADTVELRNGPHYNNHPTNRTIGHWIVGYGYSASGRTVRFADPSTSVWPRVNRKFSFNTAKFTNNFLQFNGIAF